MQPAEGSPMGIFNWFHRKQTAPQSSLPQSKPPPTAATAPAKTSVAKAAPPRTVEQEKARYQIPRMRDGIRIRRPFFLSLGLRSTRTESAGFSREKLAAKGLPLLFNAEELANQIGLTPRRLHWLATKHRRTASPHYVTFRIAKKSGGEREISRPRPQLEACQRWILHHVLSRLTVSDAAHGFVSGRSIATHAIPHVKKRCVVQLDLKDFFPSVTIHRVARFFEGLGYDEKVARVLASLCTEPLRHSVTIDGVEFQEAYSSPRLPQGACTSPMLSNLIARSLDRRLTGLAQKAGWSYTRYADDLTFSTDSAEASPGYMLHRVRAIVREEGFRVNEEKTRIQRRSGRQQVTGLVVNDQLSVPRETVRRLRAILHRAKTEGLDAQNREHHPRFAQWIAGMISYISMIHPDKGLKLSREYQSILGREADANANAIASSETTKDPQPKQS